MKKNLSLRCCSAPFSIFTFPMCLRKGNIEMWFLRTAEWNLYLPDTNNQRHLHNTYLDLSHLPFFFFFLKKGNRHYFQKDGCAYSLKQSEKTIYFLHRWTSPSILNSLWCKNPNTPKKHILLLVHVVDQRSPDSPEGFPREDSRIVCSFHQILVDRVTRKNPCKDANTPCLKDMRFLRKCEECVEKTLTPCKLQSEGPNQI